MTTLIPKYDLGQTGTSNRTISQKFEEVVSVKDFGATGDGLTNDTTAIQDAIDYVSALTNGGALHFPAGTYLVDPDTLTFNTADKALKVYGDGPFATLIDCPDSGIIFNVDLTASNSTFFHLSDLAFNGGGELTTGTALYLNQLSQGAVENVAFQNVEHGIKLSQVFSTTFKNLRFRNYVTGITGVLAKSANNNTFIDCYFSDGYSTVPATAQPIVSYNMAYNTYINCDFESSGLIAGVDMTGGSGQDTMIGCRFERLNAGTSSWLKVGNQQQYINCSWHVTGTYNCVGTAYYLIEVGDATYGRNNKIDGINISNSNYVSNTLAFKDGAVENYARFLNFEVDSPYDTVYNPVTDYSQGQNVVEFPGGGCQSSSTDATWSTWGGGPVNQLFWDSVALGRLILDGLTNSGYATGSSVYALGPFGDGYSNDITSPTGNKKGYIQHNMTAGDVYIFSIWVLPKTANDTVALSVGLSLGSPSWKSFTLPYTDRWQRIFIAYKAPSSSVGYFQIQVNGATGAYLSAPQFEEWSSALGRFGPSGYVRSSTVTGGQYYSAGCTPEKPNKNQMFGTGIPTVGTYTRGNIVWNLDATSGGAPGWVCTASGTPGTWKAMANLA